MSKLTTPTIPGLDLGLLSSEYVEQVYALYEQDPAQVSPEWQTYFRGLESKPGGVQSATVRPLRSGAVAVMPGAAGTGPASPAEGRNNGTAVSAPPAASGNGAPPRPSQALGGLAGLEPATPDGNGAFIAPALRKPRTSRPHRRRRRRFPPSSHPSGRRTPRAACRRASTSWSATIAFAGT